MKKTMMIVMIAVLSAAFMTIDAKKDKKKVVAAEPVKPAVVLTTSDDSLCYAAGYSQTQGLVDYLVYQKMDTAYMADFIKGMKEAIEKSEDPSFVAYSLGLNIAGQINGRMIPDMRNNIDSLNTDVFYQGFFDALGNDTTHYNLAAASKYFQTNMQRKVEQKQQLARKAGEDWLAENAKKEGVITTPSGLQYKVLVQGNGVVPRADQEVTVKYEGKLIDGTVFDSSYARNPQTTKFKPTGVIKGWTEALTMMPVGSTWELYIPQNLGYGARDNGKIPPFSTLIFKVELVDVAADKPAEPAKVETKPAVKATSARATPAKKPAAKAKK